MTAWHHQILTTLRQTRVSHFLRSIGVAAGIALGLLGCGASPTVGGGYNATTPTNIFEEALFEQLDSNVVVIANVNLGGPSRNYLKKREAFVDTRVQEYLESAGYDVRPQREFSQRWNNAVLIYGDPIDPTTGRVNQKSFIQIVQAVKDQLVEQTDISSIIFTDIIEKDVYYETGLNRVTRFDGVTHGLELHRAHRQNFGNQPVELVEAAPRATRSKTLEDVAQALVVHLGRAVEDVDDLRQG